jgi:hypothetical protein
MRKITETNHYNHWSLNSEMNTGLESGDSVEEPYSQGFKVLSKSAEIVSREYCKSDFRSSRELSLTTNRYQLIDIIGGESGLKPIELKALQRF